MDGPTPTVTIGGTPMPTGSSTLDHILAGGYAAIRELRIGTGGLLVWPKLDGFRGVLTGTPTYTGQEALLR